MQRALLAAVTLIVAFVLARCDSSVQSPFSSAPGNDAGSDVLAPVDSGPDVDPTVGGPCVDDGQCDDQVECTFDVCDQSIARCRHTPDPSPCQNPVYCDGAEICDPKLGCRPGEPIACSDQTTCTIDSCVEKTQTCVHVKRDADGDGDPDWGCGGTDCNDVDPKVNGKSAEICGNGVDDNCDTAIDESGCVNPKYDGCVAPLEITKSGQYNLSFAGLSADFGASCLPASSNLRDGVVAIIVPGTQPQDVDIVATAPAGELALAAFGQCGAPATETACHGGVALASGTNGASNGKVARLRLRGLAPGAHAVVVFADFAPEVSLKVTYLPASGQPTNETCGTATPIAPGVNQTVSVIDPTEDLSSQCEKQTGELVFSIDVPSAKDVHAYAVSLDGIGQPSVALWQAPCSVATNEVACSTGKQGHAFLRNVGPTTLYLAVAATAPSDIDVLVSFAEPSAEPLDETCSAPPVLAPFSKTPVSLAGHVDAAKLGCLPGAVDAAYTLTLDQQSDVHLVARISDEDNAAVVLAKAPCASVSDSLECSTGSRSPLRVGRHALAAGSYRAVVESATGSPTELSALVRPATAPVFVAFADTCAEAVTIPETGGFFQGNTANAGADFSAGCDFAPGASAGAPDQMLQLTLSSKRRVVFDMKGSGFSTLLNVRKGPSCPGSEIVDACAAGYVVDKSFLDLVLDAGTYFVQVDGYNEASGPWFLDVFVGSP
jgi:hypothetical protein